MSKSDDQKTIEWVEQWLDPSEQGADEIAVIGDLAKIARRVERTQEQLDKFQGALAEETLRAERAEAELKTAKQERNAAARYLDTRLPVSLMG